MPYLPNKSMQQRELAPRTDDPLEERRTQLRAALGTFTSKVSALASRISTSLPGLTVHDITHLNALWETADLIAGPGYPLNPMEAFVLGGAILLHDAALCAEAYEGGLDGLRNTVEWQDSFAAEKEKYPDAHDDVLRNAADFTTFRLLHAREAAELVERQWTDPDSRQPIFLIDDSELRKHYGPIIGSIAASHHWPIEDVLSLLPYQINAVGGWPSEWRIDPVKLACLLRCADAAQIDSRRAPDFLHALTRRQGVSLAHWQAQNWLAGPDLDQADTSEETIIYTSNKDFEPKDFDAWWVAYDAITLVDAEIRSSNALLQSRNQSRISPPFKIRRVSGASSPEQMNKFVRARGWRPWSAKLHVGNVERVVRSLGGENLYGKGGNNFQIVIREIIQNARDAIIARRKITPSFTGTIELRLQRKGTSWNLEIKDDGVGMSERVLTGPLLDFGTSFWSTSLLQEEFPGLRSSGFKPVGKFGIGFYSVFMIADDVRVSSRRWDRGLETTCSLHFPRGLTLRPIVSSGNQEGFDGYTSTIVSFALHRDVIGENMTSRVQFGLMGASDLDVSLADFLAVLTAGIDVLVKLIVDDQEPVVVHQPISSTLGGEGVATWIRQISFAKYLPSQATLFNPAEAEARLRPLIQENNVVGVAALNVEANNHFSSVMTVGGLATSVSARHASGIVGFMDYHAGSAKREPSKLVASGSTLQAWANEQIDLLEQSDIDPFRWCIATCSLADFDIDPSRILRAAFVSQASVFILKLEEIFRHLCMAPIAVFKSGFMFHIDQYVGQRAYENYLTFLPLKNSKFLSLNRIDPNPTAASDENSFFDCLNRYCVLQGRKLTWQIVKQAAPSQMGGVADAVLLSFSDSQQ
jgi:hypothetical protein